MLDKPSERLPRRSAIWGSCRASSGAPSSAVVLEESGKLRELRAALPGGGRSTAGATVIPWRQGRRHETPARAEFTDARAELLVIGEDSGLEVAGPVADRACTRRARRRDPVGQRYRGAARIAGRRAVTRASLSARPRQVEASGAGTLSRVAFPRARRRWGLWLRPIFVPEEGGKSARARQRMKRRNSTPARAAAALALRSTSEPAAHLGALPPTESAARRAPPYAMQRRCESPPVELRADTRTSPSREPHEQDRRRLNVFSAGLRSL